MVVLQDLDFRTKEGVYLRKKTNLLTHQLKNLLNIIYTDDINHIVKCINTLKLWIDYIINHNNTIINLKTICNQYDFCTLENINKLNLKQCVQYNDQYNNTYLYRIDSIYEWIKRGNINNPFNNKALSKQFCSKVMKLGNAKKLKYKPHKFNDKLKQNKSKLIDLFYIIDKHGYYTNIDWFLDLNLYKLKKWYYNAQDIWYYRAKLTNNDRERIVPNGKCFKKNLNNVISKEMMQRYVLNEIESLITTSNIATDRATGCLYVLIAFTTVHPKAAETMNWLN